MLDAIFATKLGMTQAWSKNGKRLAVTKCKVQPNAIIGQIETKVTDKSSRIWKKQPQTILEVGYGARKLKNVEKPLRTRLEKGGFAMGVAQVQGVKYVTKDESPLKVGDSVALEQVLTVGDVVKVQGITKGHGFTGAMKRHGFHGGPKTHGQSDRARAVGSVAAGTSPGHVFKGKRMPGHSGADTQTVYGLIVLHIDAVKQELWLSGPVPGFNSGALRIEKTGKKKNVELDLSLMGLEVKPTETAPVEATEAQEVQE